MDKKSIKKIIQKKGKYYSDTERHSIIKEMLENKLTKQEVWEKYTGEGEEHGQLYRWMESLGYNTRVKTRRPNFESKQNVMPKKGSIPLLSFNQDDSFENLQLKKRIRELENQLKDAEMKAIAFSTMVDIAEREFKIPIRKKLNTKPSNP